MRLLSLLLILLLFSLSANEAENRYRELSEKIIKELNYIYQGRSWSGGSTYSKGREFRYEFKAISPYEIEINRRIDGVCLEEPFIIDLRLEYYIQLESDTKCDPAIVISHELDIIYLYVKDRCGHFGGFNLYKRAEDIVVLLKEHFHEAYRLNK